MKQLHHLLKTMRIFAWSRYLQKLVSVGVIRRFIFNFFIKAKLQSTQKGQAPTQIDRSSASSETSFHGLPSKSKRPSIRKHSVVVIITVNSISFYETAICREIFSKYFFASIFVNFQKILAAHQNTFRKVLESSQKNTRGEVLCQ